MNKGYPPQPRKLLLVRLHQEAQLQRHYVAQLPRWRHPLIGYIASIPLTAFMLLIPMIEQHLTGQNYFLGSPFFLVTVIVALFWGTGPAICSILSGIIALDYFFLPPIGQFSTTDWHAFVPLAPYFTAELIVAFITAQRERARRQALFAEQELQSYAQELEQTNEQLQQTNQLKDVFFSRASHELKTPLTTIQGQAQIGLRRFQKMRDIPFELIQAQTSLEKIDAQAHRLHALIDDLLDISMLNAGKMKLLLKSCDLTALCQSVIEDQRLLSEREIQLASFEQNISITADADRLTQVILNLVTNAIKYSTPHTPITLSLDQLSTSKQVQLCIHNEGPAIPLEQQEHIFEPFYRVTHEQIVSHQGWGLGLAICKDIIERHQGTIQVTSSTTHGTTFTIELPLQQT